MKYFRVKSAVFSGVRVIPVEVECVQSRRLPYLQVLGCSPAAANELRERISAAFSSSRLAWPTRRVTVRLSPPLAGAALEPLDLAVAVAMLGSGGAFPQERVDGLLIFGSLGLDGRLQEAPEGRLLRRVLREGEFGGALLPWRTSSVLEQLKDVRGGGFRTLCEVLEFLRASTARAARPDSEPENVPEEPVEALIERVEGQSVAKRMLEIAAAGAHHSLLLGPRGMGKSLLARALPGLLPPLPAEMRDEVALVYRRQQEPWDGFPPFRAPEPGISSRRLLGCQRNMGELSLAHGGVLFLDEFLEHPRESLESLRVPMERGVVRLPAAGGLPADALVLAAANLCPCGGRGDPRARCTCSQWDIRRYGRRLSLALEDRFDLRHLLPARAQEEGGGRVSHAELRKRVSAARALMTARQGRANGRLELAEALAAKRWEESARERWRAEADRLGVSLRGAASLARVALTVSDLEGAAEVREKHVFEAAHYRFEPGL